MKSLMALILSVFTIFAVFADEYSLSEGMYRINVSINLPDKLMPYYDAQTLARSFLKTDYEANLPETVAGVPIFLDLNVSYNDGKMMVVIKQQNFKYIDTKNSVKNVFIAEDYQSKPLINVYYAFQAKTDTVTWWIKDILSSMPRDLALAVWDMPVSFLYILINENGDSLTVLLRKMPNFGRSAMVVTPIYYTQYGKEPVAIYLRDNGADRWYQVLLQYGQYVIDDRMDIITDKITTSDLVYRFFDK